MELKDKIALVTGGASRVGRVLSLGLAKQGMHVAFTFTTSVTPAQETKADILARGVRTSAIQCDQSDPQQVKVAVDHVLDAFGRIDVLVNNAAILQEKPFLEISPEDWDLVMGINLKGPFLFTQVVGRKMGSMGGGCIINITDDPRPWPFSVHHSVSKAGVAMLTRATALALAPEIRVNAIAPGPIMKPVTMTQEDYDRLAKSTPLKRLGSAEDVLQAVLYLLEADWVTGHVMVVDGGRSI